MFDSLQKNFRTIPKESLNESFVKSLLSVFKIWEKNVFLSQNLIQSLMKIFLDKLNDLNEEIENLKVEFEIEDLVDLCNNKNEKKIAKKLNLITKIKKQYLKEVDTEEKSKLKKQIQNLESRVSDLKQNYQGYND